MASTGDEGTVHNVYLYVVFTQVHVYGVSDCVYVLVFVCCECYVGCKTLILITR